jgi:integrase
MPTIRFTARALAALKPPQAGQMDYWDRSLPRFGMRVSPTRKVWTVYYRHRGRKRRLTLGKYPDMPLASARVEAKTKLHEIALGADPSADKQADRDTFDETVGALAKEYTRRAEKRRGGKEDARILRREVLPAWERRLVRDITRRDVRTPPPTKAETAPIMANRLLGLLSRFFNYALTHDWIEANPAHLLAKPSPETSRDRLLTHDELRELWAALAETVARDEHDKPRRLEDGRLVPRLTEALNDAFKAMLWTAQRCGEVSRMRWADVDLEQGWWTIPGCETKNGDEHRVPLTTPVLTLLKTRHKAAIARAARMKPLADGTRPKPVYVFANHRGTRSVAARAKKAASHLSRGGVSFAFRAHDLRRTAASGMAAARVSREHIAHVLNHRSVTKSTVTAVYDRYTYDREKRAALETWRLALDVVLTGKPQRRVLTFGDRVS